MRFSPKIMTLGKLRVILVPEDRESVTVRVMLGTGSREETDKEAGSAHFLEHFVFKGTEEFPKMYDIKEAVEKVGGAFNAYTGHTEMGFWVKMDKANLRLATKIVGQVVTKPVLPEEHFDKERGTILEELYMYEDRPNSKAAEECEKIHYGKNAMGRPIIGTVKSLKAMTVKDLRKYFEKWFVAENMVLGIVGGYGDEAEAIRIIEKEFAPLIGDTRKLPKQYRFNWDTQTEVRTKLTSRKSEQAAVVMAFRGFDTNDDRRFAMGLVNIIFGDSWMSRLLKEVREERGWAYAIGSDVDLFSDGGSVYVGAGLPKNKLKEAVELIVEIATGLGVEGRWQITEEELEVAKETFRGRMSLSFDKPENVLGNALYNLTFRNKVFTPEEVIEKVNEVTIDQVYDLAKEIFQKKNLSISVVGQYKSLDLTI